MDKYCICFCRVSTQQQDLVQQTNSIMLEAERMGYNKDHQIIIEYKESGISLSSNERAGIDKLKDTVINNPNIDCVICWELSRIGRRADVIYNIRDFFLEHKIQWVVMNPYMRLLENDGRMSQTSSIMLALFTSLAESEMSIKQERFARGKSRSRELGKYIGGPVQFGYKIDENKYIQIDEKSSAIVRQIFELYGSGNYSLQSLCEEMFEYGYFDNFSNKLSLKSFLYKVLRNSNYCGDKNRPPIISKELFNKVQHMLHDNQLNLKPSNKGEVLCKRLIYNVDGYCLTPQIQPYGYKGKKYVIYTNGPYRGTPMNVSRGTIDPIVWDCAKSLHKKFMGDAVSIKKKQIEMCESLTKKYNVAKEKCVKIREKIDRTEERYIYGKISEEKTNKIVAQLHEELIEWTNKERIYVEEIRQRMELIKETVTTNEEDLEKFTTEQKCILIRSVIERVVIIRPIPRVKKLIVKIYSKMDHKIYKYDVKICRGYFDPTTWELIDNTECWSLEDFIKPNRQGKQTPIILNPKKYSEDDILNP